MEYKYLIYHDMDAAYVEIENDLPMLPSIKLLLKKLHCIKSKIFHSYILF